MGKFVNSTVCKKTNCPHFDRIYLSLKSHNECKLTDEKIWEEMEIPEDCRFHNVHLIDDEKEIDWSQFAEVLISPLKTRIDYLGIARRAFIVQELPDGALDFINYDKEKEDENS